MLDSDGANACALANLMSSSPIPKAEVPLSQPLEPGLSPDPTPEPSVLVLISIPKGVELV